MSRAAIPPATSTALVVLAAGASQRLGQPKQLLRVSGVSLLERTVQAALDVPAIWPVIVVLGAHAERLRPVLARYPVLLADNPAWAEGMASSLRAGLATAQQFTRRLEAVVFALCDQPAFSNQTLVQLLEARARLGTSVVAASYDGHLGAPALITRPHFPALAGLTGDEGARQLFAQLPAGSVASVAMPELGIDIDTPDDLARWHAATGNSPR
ncbi:MAG TPA: nucleotidyltransferase family protein [Candidatus Synoicihabitans sp.]|nr:nucleotidyltransferase family protein [Candidatus Synoicihabitans sp.]